MTPYSNERTFRMFVAYATSHRAMLKRRVENNEYRRKNFYI